jgi:hypothetical protein
MDITECGQGVNQAFDQREDEAGSTSSTGSARKHDTTGTSDETGYRVEARHKWFSCAAPIMLDDGLLGPDWRQIHFSKGYNPAGIPEPPFGHKGSHDLLTFEAAMALAWTIIAQNGRHGIECRLVQYHLVTKHTLTKQGVVREIICDPTKPPELFAEHENATIETGP